MRSGPARRSCRSRRSDLCLRLKFHVALSCFGFPIAFQSLPCIFALRKNERIRLGRGSMFRAWAAGLHYSAAIRNLRGCAPSLKSVMVMAAIAVMAAGLGQSRVQAQSVTGTGDVTPAVPPPPLPTWDLTGFGLDVGITGKGTLIISDGGRVLSSTSIVGLGAGSEGEAIVTGQGSEWITGAFGVGPDGKGTLTIENGGKVQSGSPVNIGQNAGSEGLVTITGAGSLSSASASRS